MSITFDKIEHSYHSTTTSATADETVPAKEVIPSNYLGAYRRHIAFLNGEDVYLEGADPERDGLNFPTAKTDVSTTQAGAAAICRLTDDLYVALHNTTDGALAAFAISINGTTCTVGSSTEVNAADTDSISICRVSDSIFAALYRDEGGDDYLCVRAGSVSGTTITMGTEKELIAAAATEEETAICYISASACIVAAYADADDDLATIACPLVSTTFGTVGSVVEFDAAAPNWLGCCQMQSGYVLVVYADGGDSNKVHGRVASVSTAGAIGTPGTEKTIVDAAGTWIKAVAVENNKAIIGYLDASSDPAVIAVTTTGATGTTITAGTAVVMEATTATDVSIDMIDNTQGVIIWTDDAHASDVGECIRFSLSGTTVTADAFVDKFVDTSAKSGTIRVSDIACSRAGRTVIIFNDADNDLAVLSGNYYEDAIVDIRSAATSATATFCVVPVFNYEATI